MHHGHKTVDKEVEIFEIAQKAQVHDHTENEEGFSFAGVIRSADHLTESEIHKGRDHDQAQEAPVPPAVEHVTGYQYPPQPDPVFGQEVNGKENNAKNQKCNAVEYHPGKLGEKQGFRGRKLLESP
jgi:hypothetical protein